MVPTAKPTSLDSIRTTNITRSSQRRCNVKLSSVKPIVEDENCQTKKSNLKAKRGKRSLATERERSNPLGVKVLRRCHTQNVVTVKQNDTSARGTHKLVKNMKATNNK